MSKRIDANHNEIAEGVRAVGAEFQSLASVGRGCPDALISYRGVWYVGEIKDGSKSPSRQKLTPDEEKWHARFSPKAPVHIWRSLEDALRTIGAIASRADTSQTHNSVSLNVGKGE
jgi:hypothetical protein